MNQCVHYYKYANGKSEQGEEPSLSNDDKCIFHSSDRSKDMRGFIDALRHKDDFNFTGYVFVAELTPDVLPVEAIEKGSEFSENITINKKLIFRQATFLRGITFSNMIFEESIDMSECQFHGECYFNESEFKGKVILDKSTVHKVLSFDKSRFSADFSWDNDSHWSPITDSEGDILFTNIKVRDSAQLNFRYVDLSRSLFMGSDISRISSIHIKASVATTCLS